MVKSYVSCALIIIFSMFSDEERELDRILGGAESDKLEDMYMSPQQPDGSQELLGVVPAPIRCCEHGGAGTPRGEDKGIARRRPLPGGFSFSLSSGKESTKIHKSYIRYHQTYQGYPSPLSVAPQVQLNI